jgi:hypothetical protein
LRRLLQIKRGPIRISLSRGNIEHPAPVRGQISGGEVQRGDRCVRSQGNNMRVGRPSRTIILITLLLGRRFHWLMVGVIIVMIDDETQPGVVVMIVIRVMVMLDLRHEHGANPINENHGEHQHAAEKLVDDRMALHSRIVRNLAMNHASSSPFPRVEFRAVVVHYQGDAKDTEDT